MSKDIFVFVVCGAADHIHTLHLSLTYLKKYSKKEILVVTDSQRNEYPVLHNHVIDVRTPARLNHHQASIYLKTGIHKFVPAGNNYCYLDTDVIAVSADCDEIFAEFIAPVRFAPDHCRVRKFSSYAVNCNCLATRQADRKKFEQFMQDVNQVTLTNPVLLSHSRELQFEFDALKKSFVKKAITALRFFLSNPIFKFNDKYYFDKRSRTWHIHTGEVIMYEVDIDRMQKATGLTYNKWTQKWYTRQNEELWYDECGHLVNAIAKTFNIEVKDKNWQHWNGGVFLFNNSSHPFLEAWHNKTMHIFTLPYWKTRDQGTLIATAWEFNLAHHPTLSRRFNFIADYNNKGVQVNTSTSQITDDGFKHTYTPALIHVYHHWQDRSWPVWQWIESKMPSS